MTLELPARSGAGRPPARVLIHVQHLLGSGHLRRAALLGDALTRAGMAVTLVSGGMPVPGLVCNVERFVQLPPVAAADLSFKALVDAQGQPVDEAFRQRRRALLLEAWQGAAAQALVIELFPFGRRQLRFELLPLLEAARAARPVPVIVSSVRDVLGGSGDLARAQAMLAYFDAYFDHLLVHGDPALLPFDRTFPLADRLAGRMHYTGYVVDGSADGAPAADCAVGRDEVLVSAGGGAVGHALLAAAISARAFSTLAGLRWRVLVGAAMGEAQRQALVRLASAQDAQGIVVEPNRSDFAQLLRRCHLSISQAGYNTVIETLDAGARSVMVPFAGGSETEQSLRAQVLAERGWTELLAQASLTPLALARAVDRAAARPPPARGCVRADGADAAARLIAGWIAAAERGA